MELVQEAVELEAPELVKVVEELEKEAMVKVVKELEKEAMVRVVVVLVQEHSDSLLLLRNMSTLKHEALRCQNLNKSIHLSCHCSSSRFRQKFVLRPRQMALIIAQLVLFQNFFEAP